MGRELDYEEVKSIFEQEGCELLSEKYEGYKIKLRYRCNCGNISETFLGNFKKGSKCRKCGNKKIRESRTLLYKYVKKEFENEGCVLLSKVYINGKTDLSYICNCGNKSKIKFGDFFQGRRCKKCGVFKARKKQAHSYEKVKDIFEQNGCKLLSKEYENAHILLDYICECGNKAKISLNHFQQGRRCKKCGIEKRTGENNFNYNPNLSDEYRIDRRLLPGYKDWVKNVYKRDYWTCQKCKTRKDNNGKYKEIHAHHIENYADNIDMITDEFARNIELQRNY